MSGVIIDNVFLANFGNNKQEIRDDILTEGINSPLIDYHNSLSNRFL